ncbi:MAG: hypothetical protein IJ523_12225 [Succinivibrionaceae bacterium]|nr:hypothetical protein [Succinivibrionaceae bacterium]
MAFALTDKGNLYGYTYGCGSNTEPCYGVLGTGNDNDPGHLFTPMIDDKTPLANVVDVSVTPFSVCATATVVDSKGNLTTENQLYCWGSSIYGQLGFDNGDGGFSMDDVNNEWTGTGYNKYLIKATRIEKRPKPIDFKASEK